MPSPIATIESAIADRVKGHFGATIKACEALPAGFNAGAAGRSLVQTPAVYVALVRGEQANTASQAAATLRFGVFCVATSLNDPTGKNARHGTATQIGAYELLSRTVPLLHGHAVADLGSLKFDGFDNIFEEAFAGLGLVSYAAEFVIPRVAFPPPDPAGLTPFETFHVDWAVPPAAAPQAPMPDGETFATDEVKLPQE